MFALDRPSSPTPTFIFYRRSCPDGRLKYPVKEKVLPSNWNGSRVINDPGNCNVTLNKIELAIKDIDLQGRLRGRQPTKAEIENTLNKLLGRDKGAGNFFAVIDQIIADRESGAVLTRDGKRFSKHTIKGYRHTRDNLFKFDSKMTFDGITLNTYHELIAYFNKNHDHAINSIGKTIKNWIVFMKAAKKAGYHSNLIYLDDDFRVPVEETDDIHLDESELAKIYSHNFPNKTLDIARDWAIIDAYNGLRVCDIQALDDQNLVDDCILMVNEKTDIKVKVPMHRYVRAIIKKWKGLPPKMTDQELNRSYKEVCELAGIKEKVLYSVTKGGVRKDYYLPKYELVSNHTWRRSFITNLLDAGVPDNQVMQLAGIKKHATLMKYKKTKAEKNAKIMKEHKFFK